MLPSNGHLPASSHSPPLDIDYRLEGQHYDWGKGAYSFKYIVISILKKASSSVGDKHTKLFIF